MSELPCFKLESSCDEGVTQLRLGGEIDLASADALRERIGHLLSQTGHLQLDLSRVEFMDTSGVDALLDALGDARRDGRCLMTPEPSPQVNRLFHLLRSVGFWTSIGCAGCV